MRLQGKQDIQIPEINITEAQIVAASADTTVVVIYSRVVFFEFYNTFRQVRSILPTLYLYLIFDYLFSRYIYCSVILHKRPNLLIK